MKAALHKVANSRHHAERVHTVCLLCVLQYMLTFGVSVIWMGAVVTTLVFIRDAHLTLIADELVPVKVESHD